VELTVKSPPLKDQEPVAVLARKHVALDPEAMDADLLAATFARNEILEESKFFPEPVVLVLQGLDLGGGWPCDCSIFRRDSLAFAIARSRAASPSSCDIDSRSLANSLCSSPRSKPAKRRPVSYIHAAPASTRDRNTSIPSQRQYQATCI
jgi:hypothetical protein